MEFLLQKLLSSAIHVIIIGLITGFIFALVPGKLFLKFQNYYKLFRFEQEGRFYNKYFKINIWKDKLPQFSELTKFGFSKSSLNNVSGEYLEQFYIETMRAELSHWFLIMCSPIYFLFAEKILLWFTIIGNIIGNLPFIMIQRYNRGRILKLLAHLKKHEQAK